MKIECEWCQLDFDVDPDDITDQDGDRDGYTCPDCGQTTYIGGDPS